jgi:hypothetical protein
LAGSAPLKRRRWIAAVVILFVACATIGVDPNILNQIFIPPPPPCCPPPPPPPPPKPDEAKAEYMYLWTPRTSDVPKTKESQDTAIVTYLLDHATGFAFTVARRDSIDKILRTQLFVWQAGFPTAYALYLNEVRRRNPRIHDLSRLAVGRVIYLPSGPKFAALDHPEEPLELYKEAVAQSLADDKPLSPAKLDSVLWRKAHIFTRFGCRQSVQSSPKPAPSAVLTSLQQAANQELIERRVLPAFDASKFPGRAFSNEQPVTLSISPYEPPIPSYIRPKTYPAFLPASTDFPEDCQSPCKSCRDVLSIRDVGSLKDVELLIADTGVSKISAKTIYSPPSTHYDDLATNLHGTFVYSETISSKHFGPLPDDIVYVAKVARQPRKDEKTEFGYVYDMPSLTKALNLFKDTRVKQARNKDTFPAWVANISAAGQFDRANTNFLTDANGRILFVAAAGNFHNNAITDQILFPDENFPKRNLLIVGALGVDGKTKAAYSDWSSSRVDIFTSGSCVCGVGNPSMPYGGQINGTSQATPIASVAATILAAEHPSWTPQEIKWRLISTSTELDNFNEQALGGILNMQDAVNDKFTLYCKDEGDNTKTIRQVVDRVEVTKTQDYDWRTVIGPIVSGSIYEYVLRIHRQPCNPVNRHLPGDVCFKQYRQGDFAREVPIPAGAKLLIQGNPYEADKIDDLILTVHQAFSHAILTPAP